MKSRLSLKCFGFTLIELIIAILVMAVVFVGVIKASAYFLGASADPILRQQSIYIAQMFIAEIQSKEYSRENGANPPCPPVPGSGTRQDFTHICHYRNFNQVGIEDQSETSIVGLEGYRVAIELNDSRLGPNGNRTRRRDSVIIEVRVTAPNDQVFVANFYRANVPVEPG